jgi:hypothetical protein
MIRDGVRSAVFLIGKPSFGIKVRKLITKSESTTPNDAESAPNTIIDLVDGIDNVLSRQVSGAINRSSIAVSHFGSA